MKIRLYGGSRHGDVIDIRADDNGVPFMDSVDVMPSMEPVFDISQIANKLPEKSIDIERYKIERIVFDWCTRYRAVIINK